jgi:hypothetical protein
MDDARVRELLTQSERKATTLFSSTSIVVAITVGAMLVSGWKAGSLDNRVEWIFWAGAIIGAVGIVLFGLASLPTATETQLQLARIDRRIRIGMILFLLAPALCVFAVMADYWIVPNLRY